MPYYFWPVLNILLLSIMMVIIFVYLLKKEKNYRRELLDKIDNVIMLMQKQKQQ